MKWGSLQFPTFGSELFRGAIPGLSCSIRREGGTSFRPRTHAHFCVWVLIGSVCLQPLKLESVMSIVAPRVEGCAWGLKLRRGGAGFSRREGKNLAFVFVRCIQFFCVVQCRFLCVKLCRPVCCPMSFAQCSLPSGAGLCGSGLCLQYFLCCLCDSLHRSSKKFPAPVVPSRSEPWRRRDVPRAGRRPRRRAARGSPPSARPSAARRGARRSAAPAGASPRRSPRRPKALVRLLLGIWFASQRGWGTPVPCVVRLQFGLPGGRGVVFFGQFISRFLLCAVRFDGVLRVQGVEPLGR